MDVNTPKAAKTIPAPATRATTALRVSRETLMTLDPSQPNTGPSPQGLTTKCVTFNVRAIRGRNAA